MVEIVRILYLPPHLFEVLQIQLMEMLGNGPVGGTVCAEFVGRNTFADLNGNLSACYPSA